MTVNGIERQEEGDTHTVYIEHHHTQNYTRLQRVYTFCVSRTRRHERQPERLLCRQTRLSLIHVCVCLEHREDIIGWNIQAKKKTTKEVEHESHHWSDSTIKIKKNICNWHLWLYPAVITALLDLHALSSLLWFLSLFSQDFPFAILLREILCLTKETLIASLVTEWFILAQDVCVSCKALNFASLVSLLLKLNCRIEKQRHWSNLRAKVKESQNRKTESFSHDSVQVDVEPPLHSYSEERILNITTFSPFVLPFLYSWSSVLLVPVLLFAMHVQECCDQDISLCILHVWNNIVYSLTLYALWSTHRMEGKNNWTEALLERRERSMKSIPYSIVFNIFFSRHRHILREALFLFWKCRQKTYVTLYTFCRKEVKWILETVSLDQLHQETTPRNYSQGLFAVELTRILRSKALFYSRVNANRRASGQLGCTSLSLGISHW